MYFASISNTQRPKSGRQGTTVGLGLCPAPRPEAAPSQSLSRRVLLLLPYALPFPIFLHFLHFVPIALTLEYWGPWKYRKGSFLFKSPFSVESNSSPREWYESWGEAQFGSSCCFIRRISFWGESEEKQIHMKIESKKAEVLELPPSEGDSG